MGGRRLQTRVAVLGARILKANRVENGLTGFLRQVEPLKRNATTSFDGVNFRTLFLTARREGRRSLSSQHKNPESYFHGSTAVGTPESNSTEQKAVTYWPSSWLKAFSGRVQSLEIEEVLSRIVNTRKRKDLSVAASSFVHRRQMVQNTSRRHQKSGEKPSSVLQQGVKYNVIRIDNGGGLQHLELKSSELGVHPRDVDLLSSSRFIPQRATITVQRDKVLVRMENVRAIVYKDHVLLFDAHHPRVAMDGVFVSPERSKGSSKRTSDAFAESLAQNAKEIPSDLLDPMPFHLRVMESLLEETSNFFHQRVDRLKLVVERILQELTNDVSMRGLQTLLPLKRAVTELEHDVRDAHQAMDQVLCSDENLQTLCLVNDDCNRSSGVPSARLEQHQEVKCEGGPQLSTSGEDHIYRLRQAVVDMLLTYQREVDDAGGVLEELRKGMEAAKEVWELGLDTTRNRIIRMNLYISMIMCSLAVSTIPLASFGMNLPSGFEEYPTLFYWVVGAASTAPVVMLGGLAMVFRAWSKIVDKRHSEDLAGLLNLLRHLDSVDEIVNAVTREVTSSKITRREFQAILRSHHMSQFMRQKELDLIFRIFDRNHNEVLEAEEMCSSSSASKRSPSPDRH